MEEIAYGPSSWLWDYLRRCFFFTLARVYFSWRGERVVATVCWSCCHLPLSRFLASSWQRQAGSAYCYYVLFSVSHLGNVF